MRSLLALALLLPAGALLAPATRPGGEAPQVATQEKGAVELNAAQLRRARRLGPLGPPPPDPTNRVADDERAARLGHELFFDAGLSADGSVSCATCHVPELGFSDGRSLAQGLGTGTRRTPSLVNVAYHRWFFWDGRADSLWSQALGPLENPLEMGGDRVAVVRRIASVPRWRAGYEELFGPLPELEHLPPHARPVPGEPEHPHARAWAAMDPADREAVDRAFASIGKLIAAYERRLVSRESPFDRWLASLDGGPPAPLEPAALRGLRLFVGRAGCILCHDGPLVSDLEFHNTSAPPLGGGELLDPGRYRGVRELLASSFHAAGPHSDDPEGPAARRVESLRDSSETWGEFKTPSLRNLRDRRPLMHQGQFPDLEAVLHFYSTLEGAGGRNHHAEAVLTPFELDAGEAADLAAFLASLEGLPVPAPWNGPPEGAGDGTGNRSGRER